MNFSEFLREQEEIELLDEALLEEGVVGGTLRAMGGFGGNLITQTARGARNIAGGALGTLGGVGKVGLGAIQGVTGAGRRGASTIGSGISDVASGVGTALKGAAQVAGVASGITPTMRAAQAATERSFFTPLSNRRTGLQKAMGLNSWDPEGDAKKDRAERFKQLKDMYRAAHKAGNFDLKRKVRAEMEKVDLAAYEKEVEKSRAARAERARKRWASFADRVEPVERPEDFLARLSAEN
jgi:hypothetical protein